MAYRFLIDTAIDVIKKRYDNESIPSTEDTVCVICAGNGNVYTGKNVYALQGGTSGNIHAEIDALNKMKKDGETVVKAITVFSSFSSSPILPCDGCINLIISLNPENMNTLVVTPNGDIRITEVGNYAYNSVQAMQRTPRYSVYNTVPEHSRGSSLYTLQDSAYINMNSQPLDAGRREQSHGKPLYMPKSVSENFSSSLPSSPSAVSNILKDKLNSILGDK